MHDYDGIDRVIKCEAIGVVYKEAYDDNGKILPPAFFVVQKYNGKFSRDTDRLDIGEYEKLNNTFLPRFGPEFKPHYRYLPPEHNEYEKLYPQRLLYYRFKSELELLLEKQELEAEFKLLEAQKTGEPSFEIERKIEINRHLYNIATQSLDSVTKEHRGIVGAQYDSATKASGHFNRRLDLLTLRMTLGLDTPDRKMSTSITSDPETIDSIEAIVSSHFYPPFRYVPAGLNLDAPDQRAVYVRSQKKDFDPELASATMDEASMPANPAPGPGFEDPGMETVAPADLAKSRASNQTSAQGLSATGEHNIPAVTKVTIADKTILIPNPAYEEQAGEKVELEPIAEKYFANMEVRNYPREEASADIAAELDPINKACDAILANIKTRYPDVQLPTKAAAKIEPEPEAAVASEPQKAIPAASLIRTYMGAGVSEPSLADKLIACGLRPGDIKFAGSRITITPTNKSLAEKVRAILGQRADPNKSFWSNDVNVTGDSTQELLFARREMDARSK